MMENPALMDVTISLQNMVISDWLQGVGSCWIGAFNEIKLKKNTKPTSRLQNSGISSFWYT